MNTIHAPPPASSGPTYLRVKQIIGPNGILPISRACFFAYVQQGILPAGIKLGGVTVWSKDSIIAAVEKTER